jgi:DNA invertase Pin-like site-specific DNA recombinase
MRALVLPSASPAAPSIERIDDLVVVRESAVGDLALLAGMIQQTHAFCTDLPGAAEVARAGLRPLTKGDFGASVERRTKQRSALFVHEGVMYFYSMASAASFNAKDEASFAAAMMDLLARFRPRRLRIANLSRLLRSLIVAGQLVGSIFEHVDELRVGSEIWDLNTTDGQMRWQVHSLVAAMERDYIVMRTTAGKLGKYRSGKWFLSKRVVPMGFKLVDRVLTLDLDQVEAVREALIVVADSKITRAAMKEQLDKLGLSTPHARAYHGEAGTVADFDGAGTVQTVQRQALMLRDGEYRTSLPNPFKGLTELNGAKVKGASDDSKGYFEFVYKLPAPPGGWASDAVFAGIEESLTKPRMDMAVYDRSDRKPLSGLPSSFADGEERRLWAVHERYHLLTRVEQLTVEDDHEDKDEVDRLTEGWPTSAPWTTSEGRQGRLIASVPERLLHRSIADGVADAITEGVDTLALDGYASFEAAGGATAVVDVRSARRRRLQAEIDECQREADQARINANGESGDEVRAGFLEDVRGAYEAKRRLQKNLDALGDSVTASVPDEVVTEVGFLLRGLATLATADGKASPGLREAVRGVFSRLEFSADLDFLHWSADVDLAAEGSVYRLGPIEGKVRNSLWPKGDDGGARNRAFAERFMTQPESMTEIARVRGIENPAGIRRWVTAGLGLEHQDSGRTLPLWAVQAMVHCGVPVVRRTVWARLAGLPDPAGLDPAYCHLIERVYFDELRRWSPNWWAADTLLADRLVAALVAEGGSAQQKTLITRLAKFGTNAASVSRVSLVPDGTSAGGLFLPPVERFGDWTPGGSSDGWVRLVECIHCGERATTPIRVPEVEDCLLCLCGRMPRIEGSPRFPDEYLAKDLCLRARVSKRGGSPVARRTPKGASKPQSSTGGSAATPS